MLKSYTVILKLIDRYDYGGALEILEELGLKDSVPGIVMNSCRYAANFDFKTAQRILSKLPEDVKKTRDIIELHDNLAELIEGDPNALFSELLENIKFRLVNEEYIDFLGRVFRFKEAVFKYMFLKKHYDRKKLSLNVEFVSKRNILKMLRNKYKIFNANLVYGLTTYIQRFQRDESKFQEVARLLNSEKMNELIELRNGSIVGHGFMGVSRDEIYKAYGNPYNVLDDFRNCLEKLDIRLNRYKYSQINTFINSELELLNLSNVGIQEGDLTVNNQEEPE